MGEHLDDEIVSDLGSSMGIDFPYDYFAVIIISASNDDESDFFSLKNKIDSSAEKLENEFYCFPLVYSGKNVFIINIEKEDYDFSKKHLDDVSSFLRTEVEDSLIITAGNIYDSITGISLSYSEALQVLEYRTLPPRKGVLLFCELKEREKRKNFSIFHILKMSTRSTIFLQPENMMKLKECSGKILIQLRSIILMLIFCALDLPGLKNIL